MANLYTLKRLANCLVPFVGISREGMPPLILKRSILKGVIDALEDASEEELRSGGTPEVRVEVNGFLDIQSAKRAYKVFNVTETNSDCSYERVCRALERWAKQQREKRAQPKPKRKGPTWLVNQIKASEARIRWPIQRREDEFGWLHPRAQSERSWGFVNDEFRGLTAEEAHTNRVSRVQAYVAQRPARVALAKIAARYLRRRLPLETLYAEVRKLGHELEPLSRQPKHVRDAGPEEFAKRLPRHVKLLHKPEELRPWAPVGSDLFRQNVDRLTRHREAQAKIDALRDLLARYERGEDVAFDETFEEGAA